LICGALLSRNQFCFVKRGCLAKLVYPIHRLYERTHM
jgi:hypothetical protein